MTVPAEIGSHDRSTMVPSSGSAEILGPEYESQPDQQSDMTASLTPPDQPDQPLTPPAPGPGRPA
jgi:hypothetical protein